MVGDGEESSGGSKGGARDAPPGPKFFQFHAVFGKIWQHCMLAPPPLGSWRPLIGEILDPPLERNSEIGIYFGDVLK